MTAPAYTTDLSAISNGEEAANYSEPTGATAGALAMNDTDFFIQGTAVCSKTQLATGYAGIIYNSGGAKTIPSNGAVMVWMFYSATPTLATEANGGFRVIMGSATSAFRHWYVRGSDTYAYGGWICVPVDPTVSGDGSDTGSPNMSSLQYFGTIAYVPGPGYAAKGNVQGLDAMRYGRCEARIANGSTADGYATFLGYSGTNDNVSNRWGLIQALAPGVHSAGYQVQGLVILGYGAATDFRDSNTSIVILNTKKVSSSFNGFEVRNASSRVDWTNIFVTALGTVSKGFFLVTDNADVNKDGCVFTDMDYFTYLSGSTILNSTYRRCGLVTQGGAVVTNCIFENASGAVAIKASNPSAVTGCKFTSDGSNHAMEASTAGDYDWNNTLVGYATSDGSGGNEAFYNNSGGHINLTVVGGTRPYVRNGTSATTDVIIPDVTLTISAPVSLVGAEIRIYDMDDTLPNLGTELAGTESHNAATYAFSGSASNVIWVQIMLAGYEEYGVQTQMPTANGSFVALLKKELNA